MGVVRTAENEWSGKMKHEVITNFEAIPSYVPPTHKEMAQVFFDCVCGHLLKQKRHSRVKPRGKCVYRAKDGLMCAIGCLMDDRYDPIMEGRPIGDEEIMTAFPEFVQHLPLLHNLQMIHDRQRVRSWRARLRDLSRVAGLEFRF
jgi:hypothetical protein